MYRFLFSPRWLVGSVVAVAAIGVCLMLGSWQLGRFESRVSTHQENGKAAAAAAEAEPRSLAEVLPDAAAKVGTDTLGRTVNVTGSYDTAHQLLVPNRTVDGRQGYYVLTPLLTDGGRAVPVVRGWAAGSPGRPRRRRPGRCP
ncbi:membrane protein [Kitasatospora cheerisanensis KCTC 2395]|uniref:SURF1-like protein n=1 Tax=Kitasatospora cheerisanensis KCTC 2395 TaxID=1348663 RepID=A0A066YX82_9ACTN|nr:membrane protein [Kitasatospora cheerisanensis KCTC 2395]